MNAVLNFLRARSISAHSFVGIYATFTAFLIADSTARGTVFAYLDKHPFYSLCFGFLAFAYSRYSGAHSDSGILVEAGKVLTTAADKTTDSAPLKP